MRYFHHTEQWLPYPVEKLFAFFANPNNLPPLMPAWQKARIERLAIVPPIAQPTPVISAAPAAGVGSRLTLSFLPFPYAPFRVRWEAGISEFVQNHHFCDQQLRGPFALWKHCHYVHSLPADGNDGTLIVDDVEYELPGGFAGRLAHTIFLRKQIERTFAYRQNQLARLFSAAQ